MLSTSSPGPFPLFYVVTHIKERKGALGTRLIYLTTVGNDSVVYMMRDPQAPDKKNLEMRASTFIIFSKFDEDRK